MSLDDDFLLSDQFLKAARGGLGQLLLSRALLWGTRPRALLRGVDAGEAHLEHVVGVVALVLEQHHGVAVNDPQDQATVVPQSWVLDGELGHFERVGHD